MIIGKLQLYVFASFAALFAVGYNVAAPHQGNFFRTVVALTISKWFNVVLCNAALAFVLAIFWTTIQIFLQKLHPLESQHLQERFFVFVAESVLAVAMIRGTVSAIDATTFLLTCPVSMLHVVLVKRMNMLEESAMTISRRRIIAVSVLSALLFLVDCSVVLWLGSLVWSGSSSPSQIIQQNQHGRSVGIMLILLLEWSLNVMSCVTATTKLCLLAIAAKFPSEISNSVRFYVEIVTELIRALLYVGFGFLLLQQSTMALHLVREVLSNVKRIAVLIRDFVQHRKRMHWIEQVDIPTEEQLEQDGFCNICRDEVTSPSSARILPCAHLFHVDCLAKWLERNRDCPYCNRDVEVMINDFVAAKKRAENMSSSSDAGTDAAAAAVVVAADADIKVQTENNNNDNADQVVFKTQPTASGMIDEQTLRAIYDQYVQSATKVRARQVESAAAAASHSPLQQDSSAAAAAAAAASSSSQQQQQEEDSLEQYEQFSNVNDIINRSSKTDASPTFLFVRPSATTTTTTTATSRQTTSSSRQPVIITDDDSSSSEDEDAIIFPESSSTQKKNNYANNTSSSRSVSNISNQSGGSGLDTLEAYQRYEASLDRARKQLKRELSIIRSRSASASPPKQQQEERVTTTSAETKTETNNDIVAPTTSSSSSSSTAASPQAKEPSEQQEVKKEEEVETEEQKKEKEQRERREKFEQLRQKYDQDEFDGPNFELSSSSS